MTHHGQLDLRDQSTPRSSYYESGRFGRLFPLLPPFALDTPAVRDALLELGKPGGPMDAQDDMTPGANPVAPNPHNRDNPAMPEGMTFLGQFLDHDLTFDPTSSLERQVDPESIANFRTPTLELDNLYGSGRAATPHLYDRKTPGAIKFLLDEAAPRDLPRNSQNVALIGDPRNDENLIVSQLHLAFLKFHNAVVDELLQAGVTNPNALFVQAQQLVRWHYQWIIVHEFLPLTIGKTMTKKVLKEREFYDWRREPFIPVEFSVAAYRFGHSQVRAGYQANLTGDAGRPFTRFIFDPRLPEADDPEDLRGGKRAPRRFVDWPIFFDLGDGQHKPNKRIDTKLSTPLFMLPFTGPNLPENPSSLAQRNLLRHLTFGLPSGQRVARALAAEPLSAGDLADLKPLAGLDRQTPLWFYILREAEVMKEGKQLGPVGGQIVGEVLIGLLQGDRMSYLRQDPDWQPIFGRDGDFTMADLLRFAGVAP